MPNIKSLKHLNDFTFITDCKFRKLFCAQLLIVRATKDGKKQEEKILV